MHVLSICASSGRYEKNWSAIYKFIHKKCHNQFNPKRANDLYLSNPAWYTLATYMNLPIYTCQLIEMLALKICCAPLVEAPLAFFSVGVLPALSLSLSLAAFACLA